jgi:hypothetical protein
MEAEVIKWIVIGFSVILLFIFLTIGGRKGWFQNFKAGRDGISFEAKSKRRQSGNLNKKLDDDIAKCDHVLLDTATELADNLRRGLSRYLDAFIKYPAGKRTVSGAIRIPLYNAIRRNNFKIVLRPENISGYIDKLMKDIKAEYDEVDGEQESFVCPIHGGSCVDYPAWADLETPLRKRIIEEWVMPLKAAEITKCKSKIELYEKQILIFKDLEYEDRVIICQQCIEKNENYIKELTK